MYVYIHAPVLFGTLDRFALPSSSQKQRLLRAVRLEYEAHTAAGLWGDIAIILLGVFTDTLHACRRRHNE